MSDRDGDDRRQKEEIERLKEQYKRKKIELDFVKGRYELLVVSTQYNNDCMKYYSIVMKLRNIRSNIRIVHRTV